LNNLVINSETKGKYRNFTKPKTKYIKRTKNKRLQIDTQTVKRTILSVHLIEKLQETESIIERLKQIRKDIDSTDNLLLKHIGFGVPIDIDIENQQNREQFIMSLLSKLK